MIAHRLAIPDVVLFEPKVFADARGTFFESFSQREFEQATGLSRNFVQDNHSTSAKGVLRGLHYQLSPHAQGKLVRVVAGAVFDVAVDIRSAIANVRALGRYQVVSRESSPALGAGRLCAWFRRLGRRDGIPVQGDRLLCSCRASAASSGAIREIGVDWGIGTPMVSDKDKLGRAFWTTRILSKDILGEDQERTPPIAICRRTVSRQTSSLVGIACSPVRGRRARPDFDLASPCKRPASGCCSPTIGCAPGSGGIWQQPRSCCERPIC